MLIGTCLFASSCGTKQIKESADGVYGEAFESNNIQSVDEMLIDMEGNDSLEVVVKGVISSVCKHEGCWITLKTKSGEEIYVNTKDKAFSLPTSVLGKIATAKGMAYSVDAQIAYEIASGSDKDDLDWIDNVSIEATGIIVE